jgi:hypothetical protein
MVMPALKARIVIELGIRRKTLAAPVLLQKLDDLRRVRVRCRPRADGRAEQRSTGENLAQSEAFQRQILNHIEAVQLGPALPHGRQIPARDRRLPADSGVGIL